MPPRRTALRALLANETGGGRGHLLAMASVATALADRYAFDAAVHQPWAGQVLASLCDSVFRCNRLVWTLSSPDLPPEARAATWGDTFSGALRHREFLTSQVKWWQDVIFARRTDLVIADNAPCALLAARSLGVPSVAMGLPMTVPPPGLGGYPLLFPEQRPTPVFDEAETVAQVYATLAPHGLLPLERLTDIHAVAVHLVRGLSVFDPYANCRRTPFIPPLPHLPPVPDGSGEEVFVYFSTREHREQDIVEALERLDLPARLYLPAFDPEQRARIRSTARHIVDAPVSPAEIVGRARMILCAAQSGTVSLALLAGLPVVALPVDLEKSVTARAAEATGTCRVLWPATRDADAILQAVRACHDDTAAGRRARSLAPRFRAEAAEEAHGAIRRLMAPVL